MNKLVEICNHVNMLDEAFMLLYYLANVDNMEEIKAEFEDSYQCDAEKYNKRFDLIIEMYEYVKDNLDSKKQRINYYFKERNTAMSTFAALAMLMDFHKHDNKLQTYEHSIKTITEEEKVKRFALIMNCDEAAQSQKEKLKTMSDLITFIEASPYEKEAKWEAVKIYSNMEIYYNEVYDILSETIELLKSKYDKQIGDIEREFYEYWNEYEKTSDIIGTISKKLNVSWEHSALGIIIMPIIFLPMNVTISIYQGEEKIKDVIRMSILFDERFVSKNISIKKEDIISVGKLLSDKSKVDILEYVSKKPAYGKEIANKLNLSTATISYHVNALIKVGFLRKSVSLNRVYYSIDQDRISSYLDGIKKYFNKL